MTEELATPISEQAKPSLGRRIVMFPLIRILIAILSIGIVLALIGVIFQPLGHILFPGEERPIVWRCFMWTLSGLAVALVYSGYVRWVERRPVLEFSGEGALRELWIGYLIGAGLMVTSIGIMWMLGYYRIVGTDRFTVLIVPFFAMAFTAVFEEVVFRAVIFRIIHESLGSWIAIVASAVIFGFAHGANPNATVFSSIAIALEAGILLSAMYLYTMRLWMVMGIHASWNFFQGNILGVAVSGTDAHGILQAELKGPELITGGAFGAETSLITIGICLIIGVVFLTLAHKKGNFRKPFWCRKQATPSEMEAGDTAETGFMEAETGNLPEA